MSERKDRHSDRRGDAGDGRRLSSAGASGAGAAEEPADLSAMLRDNELIEAISGTGTVATDSPEEFELATLMSQWRHEIVDPPAPSGPDLDEVEAAVLAEIRNSRGGGRRHRAFMSVAAGAAAVVAVLGGLTVASHDSKPGDALWGMNQTLFGAQSPQVQAAADVQYYLDQAQHLIDSGDTKGGLAMLDKATAMMGGNVKGSPAYDELNQRRAQLWAQATGKPATEAPPPGSNPAASTPAAPPAAGQQPAGTTTPQQPAHLGPITLPPGVQLPPNLPQIPTQLPQLPPLPTQLPQLPTQLPQLPLVVPAPSHSQTQAPPSSTPPPPPPATTGSTQAPNPSTKTSGASSGTSSVNGGTGDGQSSTSGSGGS